MQQRLFKILLSIGLLLITSLGLGFGYLVHLHTQEFLDAEVASLHQGIQERVTFLDEITQREDTYLDQRLQVLLPNIYRLLTADQTPLAQVSLDRLFLIKNMYAEYGQLDIYILDPHSNIIQTTNPKELGVHLASYGTFRERVFDRLQTQTLYIDRFSTSAVEGSLRKFAFYRPKTSSDYTLEISIDFYSYLEKRYSKEYTELFKPSAFNAFVQTNPFAYYIDLYLVKAHSAFSLIHKNHQMSQENIRKVQALGYLEQQEGDFLKVYQLLKEAKPEEILGHTLILETEFNLRNLNRLRNALILGSLLLSLALFAVMLFVLRARLHKDLISPLTQLKSNLDQLSQGHYQLNLSDFQYEFKDIAVAFVHMSHAVQARELALIEARQVLEQRVQERTLALEEAKSYAESLARTDMLTQLPNRRYLEEHFEYLIRHQTPYPLTLVIFDLDFFKKINDTYGHHLGDQVLIHVGNLGTSLIEAPAMLGRLGGEEFVILLPHMHKQAAWILMDELRIHVSQTPVYVPGQSPIYVTLSAGIVTVTQEEASFKHLLRCADEALYQAKASGRNCVRLYTPQ